MSNVSSGAKLFEADTGMADQDPLNISYIYHLSPSSLTDCVKRETQVVDGTLGQSHWPYQIRLPVSSKSFASRPRIYRYAPNCIGRVVEMF